jgi:hypothetical protein
MQRQDVPRPYKLEKHYKYGRRRNRQLGTCRRPELDGLILDRANELVEVPQVDLVSRRGPGRLEI